MAKNSFVEVTFNFHFTQFAAKSKDKTWKKPVSDHFGLILK